MALRAGCRSHASGCFLGSQYGMSDVECERRTSNIERRTSNAEHRTSNIERRTPNGRERVRGVSVLRFDVGCSALDVRCSHFGAGVKPAPFTRHGLRTGGEDAASTACGGTPQPRRCAPPAAGRGSRVSRRVPVAGQSRPCPSFLTEPPRAARSPGGRWTSGEDIRRRIFWTMRLGGGWLRL